MLKCLLFNLPTMPNFEGYNTNSLKAKTERTTAMYKDARACVNMFASNANNYAISARGYIDELVDGKITVKESEELHFLEAQFKILIFQYHELIHRYDEVADSSYIKNYLETNTMKISNEYGLGLFDPDRAMIHPETLRAQATYVLEHKEDAIPDEDMEEGDDWNAIFDALEKAAKAKMAEEKATQTKTQQTAQNNTTTSAYKKAAGLFNNEKDNQFDFVVSDKTFADVAGLKEVKEDLAQIVDFIKRPDVYKQFGAKLPKGTILYGPPGTGKTLLARAVAGEANANFIALNSTDFTASKWGEVPKMIKELFETARENTPCIIFIDEIDMLGLNRGADKANSLAHREGLNAFLCAMDGFNQYEGVTVMAATNRLEDLDPAMTRPGRFDNLFAVNLPSDINEVEEVVKIYMKNKRFDENVNSRDIAHKLLRQSPASIEGIINEACLIAIKKNNGIIREQDLNEAYLKKIMKGHVKENVEVPEEDSLLVAYHEAGHALVAVIEGVPVQSVTIMPTTTGAGGVTVMNQQNKNYYRKSDYENQIRISYGGRASEEVIFGEDLVTTGASADIQNATNMIRNAATYYGFDLCDTKKHAPLVYKEISQENLEKAANKYYKETVELLAQNVDALKAIAQELIENGTITGKRVAAIYTSFQTVDMLMG